MCERYLQNIWNKDLKKKKIMNWKLHIAIVGTEATFCDTVQDPPGAGDM